MTSAQRDALPMDTSPIGLLIFNTDLNEIQYLYEATVVNAKGEQRQELRWESATDDTIPFTQPTNPAAGQVLSIDNANSGTTTWTNVITEITGLVSVTENGNTGYRLANVDMANHGDIGDNAIDLSIQDQASIVRGSSPREISLLLWGTERLLQAIIVLFLVLILRPQGNTALLLGKKREQKLMHKRP